MNVDDVKKMMIDLVIECVPVVKANKSVVDILTWENIFKDEPVKRILGIPDDVEVIAMTPLGEPDESQPERKRKVLSDVVYQGKWPLAPA